MSNYWVAWGKPSRETVEYLIYLQWRCKALVFNWIFKQNIPVWSSRINNTSGEK